MSIVKIVSSDEVIFKEELKTLRRSKTIKKMCDEQEGERGSEKFIRLINVNSVVLDLAIKWMKFHEDNPPLPGEKDEEKAKRELEISQWETDYLHDLDPGTLFELILAADYLNIDCLLEVSGSSLAKFVIGKKPQEIREAFGIQNDFTAEEEAQVQKENDWCEEK